MSEPRTLQVGQPEVEHVDTRVTVVVPTKNAARTLGACLASLRTQTHPCTVVVVDNFSTDDTPAIAAQWADAVITAGPERSAQRNAGARAYPAPVLGFIDADMRVGPRVVAEAVEALRHGAGSVIVPERTIGEGYWTAVRAYERSFYSGSDAIEAARFFRADVFDAAGGFDERLTGPEDWDLSLSARALAPVARVDSTIEHDEGRVRYLDACRKKAYYAPGIRRYVAKRGRSAVVQAARRPWMRLDALTNPLGAGVVALKIGELAAMAASARPTGSVLALRDSEQCPRLESPPDGVSEASRTPAVEPRRAGSVARAPARVGFVTDSFLDASGRMFEGGAERHLLHLVETARDLGAEVTIYQRAPRPFRSMVEGIEVVGRPVRLTSLGRELSSEALGDGCTHLHFQFVERVPPGLRRDRVSATCHAVYWDIPYEHRYRRWYPYREAAAVALPAWRALQRRQVLRGVARCGRVLAVDSSLLRFVQSHRPGLRDRVAVILNFSDLAAEEGGSSDGTRLSPPLDILGDLRAAGSTVVLVPRNLSLVRGGPWLTDIVSATVAQEPQGIACHFALTGVPVDVYGDGNRFARLLGRDLERLAPQVRERVHLLSGVPRSLMRTAFELADVVLVPTFAHEGTSLAALEAMSVGRPVIATNIGGLNDIVRDGWTGLLVPPRPEAIARAVVTLASSPSLGESLGREARREAAARFSLPAWRDHAEDFARQAGWARGVRPT